MSFKNIIQPVLGKKRVPSLHIFKKSKKKIKFSTALSEMMKMISKFLPVSIKREYQLWAQKSRFLITK